MHKALLIPMLLAGLCGCATKSPYGNFSEAPSGYDKTLASDTVKHLVTLYLPALTRLNIMQPNDDTYGLVLVDLLRGRGYAVSEYSPESAKKAQPSTTGLPLRYVIDSLAPAVDLYRVTVVVGSKTISRAYIPQQNGTIAAAGSWVRKE